MSSRNLSIVHLFKGAKPRTKLLVQSIPPGFTEDDFKELISEYLDEINYIAFRPGKIIRDPYTFSLIHFLFYFIFYFLFLLVD